MSDDVIEFAKGDKEMEKYYALYAVICHHCGDRALSISWHDRKPRCVECSDKHAKLRAKMVDADGRRA